MIDEYHSAMVPWYNGTMVPWYHGTMGPWCHGTMVPCYHGVRVPWFHGNVVPEASPVFSTSAWLYVIKDALVLSYVYLACGTDFEEKPPSSLFRRTGTRLMNHTTFE